MIIVDCEQGTDQWRRARLSVPTASNFSKILTSTGAKSKQAAGYMDTLLAEWLAGEAEETYKNHHMVRGTALEPQARAYYEFTEGVGVERVGFVTRPDGLVGCSPDGLVGDSGGIEIKCPAAVTQIGYLRKGTLPTDYKLQVMAGLWLCERQWWDFLSYHPSLPCLLIRVERDNEFIRIMERAIGQFVEKMLEEREAFIAKGFEPRSETHV